MKGLSFNLPMTKSGMLDLAALMAKPIDEQRRLLRALNKELGPYRYEECATEEGKYLERLRASPIERRDAIRTRFERDVFAPRYAQLNLSSELKLRGLAKGSRKGAAASRSRAISTSSRIEAAVRSLRRRGERVTQKRLAEVAHVDRSTVSRHLKALRPS